MIAGFAVARHRAQVLGIDGSATVEQTWNQIARIARQTAEAIGLGRELRDDEIVLLDEWHAGTYGIPDAKTIEAIRLCARLEGVLTDPVYEGKSMAALIDLVRSGRIPSRITRPVRASRWTACAERLFRCLSPSTGDLLNGVGLQLCRADAVARQRSRDRVGTSAQRDRERETGNDHRR